MIPETKIDENDTENFYSAETDKNGIYTFHFVFPRRYLLGLKTNNNNEDDENKLDLFYPNTVNQSEATIVEFGLGQKLTKFDFIWQKP